MRISAPPIVFSLSLFAFGSFAWGAHGHFRRPGAMPRRMQALTVVSLLAYGRFVACLRRHDDLSPGRGEAAATLFALGLMGFWWAVATTRRNPPPLAHSSTVPDAICRDGPYGYVRHPFYLSYISFWAGTGLAVGGGQWVAASGLIVWYLLLARAEEGSFERSALVASYAAYRREQFMFVPWFRPRQGT